MKLGESDLTLVRIPIDVTDDDGALVAGYVPAAHALQVSHTGSALADASGTWVEIGGGSYYYQGTAADVAVQGFTIVIVNEANRHGSAWRSVDGASGIITFPFSILDLDGAAAPGCAPRGAQIIASTNGAAPVVATGTFAEIGLGAYMYTHDVASPHGFVLISIAGVDGYQAAVAWGGLAPTPFDPDGVPPAITIVSPTPDADPGGAGGFSADWATARMTPIVLQITDAYPGNLYQCLVARFPGAPDEVTVYRRGAFRGSFAALSTIRSIANGIELSVLPVGGWPSSDALNDVTFELDALDAAGNLAG